MDQNLRRYRLYQLLRNLWFWLPVFFLYFLERVSLGEALLLEVIYYLGVVLLEVPSGWFSDRCGRRLTLIASAAAGAVSCAIFALAEDFPTLAAAQGFMAACIAFNSGSDQSLLYDTLEGLGRAQEYADQEGRAQSVGFLATAAAAPVAGVLGGLDLRLAYALSLAAHLGALAAAWSFVEPPASRSRAGLVAQLRSCAARLADRVLTWVVLLGVAVTVLNHVPYEFYQPYLELLFGAAGKGYDPTPALSGVVLTATMLVAAGASRVAAPAARRTGPVAVLIASVLLQAAIIGGMGLVLHWGVVALVLLRSLPRALQTPLVGALVQARIGSEIRATFLSLLSLAGRLAFAASLALAALLVGESAGATWPALRAVLTGYACAGVAAGVVLWALRPVTDGE